MAVMGSPHGCVFRKTSFTMFGAHCPFIPLKQLAKSKVLKKKEKWGQHPTPELLERHLQNLENHLVFAIALSYDQVPFGIANEILEFLFNVFLHRVFRTANTDRYRHPRRMSLGHNIPEFLGDRLASFPDRVRQQQDELITAITRDEVRLTQS
jgi:hypothetical protein